MANQTIISGYIQSFEKYNSFNLKEIKTASSKIPGIEILPNPIGGFGGVMFLIGGAIRMDDTQWQSYAKSILTALSRVKALTIKLNFESSEGAETYTFEFVNTSVNDSDIGENWESYLTISNDDNCQVLS